MHLRGQLWLDSAPPPDVVTLFPEGFWRAHAEAGVRVEETAEMTAAPESMVKTLQRWLGAKWQPPIAHRPDTPSAHQWMQPAAGAAWRTIEAVAAKLSSVTGIHFGRWPEEYGLFVVMTKS